MVTTAALQLSTPIKTAARLHEESFDRAAANEAEANDAARFGIDYKQFYRLTIREASQKACDDAYQSDLAEVVFLLLYASWNEALDWAKTIK